MANERIFGPLQGAQAALLADLRAALARQGSGVLPRQAVPACAADLRALWERAAPDVAALAAVLWAGAMRFGDVSDLTVADVTLTGPGIASLRLRRTKTTAFGGPPRTVSLCLPICVFRELERLVQRPPGSHLFNIPYARFLRDVRAVCPHLTAHSFRRGAVRAAMERGVSDAAVMRLTGHASLTSLAVYADCLPRTWRAEMLQASAATLW
jgi:integrase